MVIVPAPGLTNHDTGFNGISAFSPSEAVAVGFSNTGAGYRPLADSWDGASWQLTALPSTLRSATLVDVAMLGHGDAWAVGKTAKAGIQKPVLVHWDGSAWTTATAPNIGGALLAVTATPPSGAWAVGYRESPHGDTGVVMRFDGTRWTDVTPPAADGMVLADVSADAAGEVWVVGYTTLGSSLAPVALAGTTAPAGHRRRPPILVRRAAAFRAVIARSSTDAWAAGMRLDGVTAQYRPLVEHWDGTAWTVVDSPPVSGESELLALADIPGNGDLWVSGHDHLIARYCGGTPSPARQVGRATIPAFRPRPMGPTARTTAPRGDAVPVVARDVAAEAGIAETSTTYGAVVADFDGDGLPGIFLGRHEAQPRMYTNLGDARFGNLDPAALSTTDRCHGCAAVDVNGDGLPELVCAHGARLGGNAKRNEVWMRNADGTWSDRATECGWSDRTVWPRQGDPGARRGRRRPARRDRREQRQPLRRAAVHGSRLYLNRGGTFVAAPEFGLDGRFGSSCVATGDVNGDGYDDVIVCANKGARLYVSDGTAFADLDHRVGRHREPARGGARRRHGRRCAGPPLDRR